MFMAKKAEFQCGCCKPEFWKNIAKEAAIEPTSTATNSQELTQCQPEDIVVKIEPRNMMNNGDDSSSTGDGMGIGGSGQEALYSLEQQGNPQRSSFVNGNAVLNLNHDPTSGTNASNTNDGFMLGIILFMFYFAVCTVSCCLLSLFILKKKFFSKIISINCMPNDPFLLL